MTLRFRQYIPVKASSGGSNPDPAVYCPINGYIPNPDIYTKDPNVPLIQNPPEGTITLLCTTELDSAVNLQTVMSTGQVNYSVYGENDTLIFTQNVNSNVQWYYEFPAIGGILLSNGARLFKIVISSAGAGVITRFLAPVIANVTLKGWSIYEAHINCPSLTSLLNAFLDCALLYEIIFYGVNNSLTILENFAKGTTNLFYCKLSDSLNALTVLTGAFQNSSVRTIDFPNELPVASNFTAIFSGAGITSNPLEHISILPMASNFSSAYSGVKKLTGTLTLPQLPNCTNIGAIASSSEITKLVFTGEFINSLGNVVSGIILNSKCEEVILPVKMTIQNFIYTFMDALYVNKVTFPQELTFTLTTDINVSNWFVGTGSSKAAHNIETLILPILVNPTTAPVTLAGLPKKLKEFDCPTLSPTTLNVAGASSLYKSLEYLNVDFSRLSPSITHSLRYNNFSAGELERISSLLPATGGTIQCGGNPGYATFDKTIAAGRGWTVAF